MIPRIIFWASLSHIFLLIARNVTKQESEAQSAIRPTDQQNMAATKSSSAPSTRPSSSSTSRQKHSPISDSSGGENKVYYNRV